MTHVVTGDKFLSTLLQQLERGPNVGDKRSSAFRTRQKAAHRLARLLGAQQDGLQLDLRSSSRVLESLLQLEQDARGHDEYTLTLQLVLSCITNMHIDGHLIAGMTAIGDLVVQTILTSCRWDDEFTFGYAVAAAFNLTSTSIGAPIATRLAVEGCDTLLQAKMHDSGTMDRVTLKCAGCSASA